MNSQRPQPDRRYLTVDGMMSGTGIRDSVEGGYIQPQALALSSELIDRISRWLSDYEQAHCNQFQDDSEVEALDEEGLRICETLERELAGAKVEYFSSATTTMIIRQQKTLPKYERLLPIRREEALLELDSGDWQRCSTALVRLSLHDNDPLWLEETFISHLSHEHPWVRGVAAMCLGDIARLHGQLNIERVVPAITVLLQDEARETRGRARIALDEIDMFISADRGEGD